MRRMDDRHGIMNAMHVAQGPRTRETNLNHLASLHALMETRSVTRAAKRVGITQSAMSHALARLRELFDDPLFSRDKDGLSPTPFCLSLAPRLYAAMGEIEAVLSAKHAFERATTTRVFRIATAEPFALGAARLLAALRAEAPSVRLVVVRTGTDTDEALAAGRIDLVVGGPHEKPRGSVRAETLLRDRFVALVGGRTLHGVSRLGAARYAAATHVVVARDERPTFVDEALRAHGLRRSIALVVPDFASIPDAVASSELVATVPSQLARRMATRARLRILPLALPLPAFEPRMYWHTRSDADPAATWLRGCVAALAKEDAPPAAR